MARVELDEASLTFEVRQQGRTTLRDFLAKKLWRRGANLVTRIPALQNISLSVREGERLGIIGHNGAGKSTLLRLLGGVYLPSSGRRVVEGRISSLFDVTLGFEMDASGYDNIFFRGYLQRETPKSLKTKVAEIAEFTELGRFLDLPVRYYSAGMLVRLGFAIATAVRPEILLLDEVMSVGDRAFQKKAKQRMQEMMEQAQLIVMVSHDLKALESCCERTLWLDHGCIRKVGPTTEVVAAYRQEMRGGEASAA
jgi:ABC-type polysaccharide/polyol phosphate transport system ATPase subunit